MPSLIPIEADAIEEIPDIISPVRPSNPLKQAVAGVTDAFTGLPMLAGAIPAGAKAAYDWAANDKEFGNTFLDELSKSDAFAFGARGREHVNNFLGIKDPVSTEDQAARLVSSSIIPVPGSVLASGIGKAAAVLTPLIRTTSPILSKGNALRYGTQVGFNVGADQGIRALMDEPLMFSDEAMSGLEVPSLISSAAAADGPGTLMPVGPDDLTPLTDADIDRAESKSMLQEYATPIGLTAATVAALFGANKLKQVISKTGPDPFNIPGQKDVTGVEKAIQEITSSPDPVATMRGQVDEVAKNLHGSMFDGNTSIRQSFERVGEDPSLVQQVENFDPVGRAIWEIRNDLGDIQRKFLAWSDDEKAIFNNGLAAAHEEVARIRGTIKDAIDKDKSGSLDPSIKLAYDSNDTAAMETALSTYWNDIASVRRTQEMVKPGLSRVILGKRDYVPDNTVRNSIDALFNHSKLGPVARELAAINDRFLDTFVSRGVKTQADIDRLRKSFTTSRGLIYTPGKENHEKANFFRYMAEKLGIHTSAGRDMLEAANLHALGVEPGSGIHAPMDPINATGEYLLQMMQHRDRSVAQWQHYSRLAGIDIAPNGDVVQRMGKGWSRVGGDGPNQEVHYVGKFKHGEDKVTWNSDLNKTIKTKFRTPEGKAPATIQDLGENIQWVERNGEFHGFYTENAGLKTALEFNMALHNNFERFWNHWKNVFTKFTTGDYSIFAPISFAYQQQIGSIVAGIRAQGVNPYSEFAKTWAGSFKGAWQLFTGNVAKDVADIAAQEIERNLNLGHMAPQAVINLKTKMERIVQNALIEPIQRETGSLASSLRASDTQQNVSNVMREALPFIRKSWGANAIPALGRVWKHANQALHEGTAYGLYLRKIAEQGGINTLSGGDLRRIGGEVKDIVGDVRSRGTSDFARLFNAAVPFSGSMLQAWSVLGKAIKENPARTTYMLGSIVGAPVATELAWNHAVSMTGETFQDPYSDHQWTYQDYYWNGFTAEQRNNNAIFFIPGKAPWEALLVPIVPELSIVRSILVEGLDAVFDLSAVGNSGFTGVNGNHFLASLSRVFDVPVPPLIAAGISTTFGMDFRVGPNFDPEEGNFSMFTAVPYAKGQQTTSKYGREKFINSEFDTRTAAVIQDLIGAAGASAAAVYEAFHAGKEDLATRPLEDRASFALGEGLRQVQTQARYTQPLFGKAISPNANGEIAKEVFEKKDALMRASKDVQALSKISYGNTIPPIDDPAYAEIAVGAKAILDRIAPFDKFISNLREMKAHYGNATKDKLTGKDLTARDRKDILDSIEIKIAHYKALQLAAIKQHEVLYSEKFGKSISFDKIVNQSGRSPARPTTNSQDGT